MAMVVKNNMSAVRTLNTLNTNQSNLTKSLTKVSSGMKINSAQDDASGYAISERMRVQIRSLDQANQNTQNGSSLMKTAEGAVSSTVEILKTLKEKVINAANDTNTDSDRATIQKELNQSIDQIDDNANVTFNGKYLVDGSKNTVGVATYTSMTNQNLSTDTTADTKLTELKSRSGDDLNITTTDKVTVSYVQQGKTYTTTFQVGSEDTLQTIFNKAEDIDTTSKTFATANNDSVKEALGGEVAKASKSSVEKSIAYLKSALSTGEASDSNKVSVKMATDVTGSTADKVANSKINMNQSWALSNTTDSTDISEANNNSVTISGSTTDTAPKGELYKALDDANEARNRAVKAMGSYASSMDSDTGDITTYQNPTAGADHSGLAQVLGDALKDAGKAWDGELSSLQTSEMQSFIKENNLTSQYTAYENAVADVEAATAEVGKALDNYNDGVRQLNALLKQKDIDDARTDYKNETDAFLTKLEKVANETSGEIQYINADGAKIHINATDDDRAERISTMIEDLRGQLSNLESVGSVKSVIGDIATNAGNDINGGVTIGGVSAASVTKTGTAGTAASADGTGDNIATDMLEAAGKVSDKINAMDNTTKTYVTKNLLEAERGIVNDYSGPQLITNGNIGTNAAGNLVKTASGDNAITFTAANNGVEGQISGFTISVSDSEGNIKKSVNASLDMFEETVRAQNKSEDNAISLQVGAKANQAIKVGLTDMRSEALGLKGSDGTKLNIGTRENANAAINVLDNALQKALDQQTTIGSIESRLEYTSSNLTTASENVQASESTIRDSDMAKEMTEYTKNNVLLQAAQTMLAQANQNSSAVLSLLQ